MQQGAEVVQRAAEKQQTAVERLVLDILCGVVEIFVGIFDVPYCGQIKFEIFVVDGYEFVINLLGAVVRGANWKPIFFVWQECKRVSADAERAVGGAAPLLPGVVGKAHWPSSGA